MHLPVSLKDNNCINVIGIKLFLQLLALCLVSLQHVGVLLNQGQVLADDFLIGLLLVRLDDGI